MRPVAWRERAGGIHVGDPQPLVHRPFDDASHKGCFSAAKCPTDLRQPPPRHSLAGEDGIELANPRCQTRGIGFREVENVGELLPEEGEGQEERERFGAWWEVRSWCVVRGAWCVVRGAWCVVRGDAGCAGISV